MKRGSIPVAVLLVFVVLLSASSGLYAGASFFAQQAQNVTVTTTILTTTTSWTTSTIWSTVTAVVLGVWTTVQYTTSTSTVTVTGSATPRAAKAVTAYGNARISTAQSKFGGASGLLHGSGDYLSLADSADWVFGAGDFTIDFWVRFNALPASGSFAEIVTQRVDDNNRIMFGLFNYAGTYIWSGYFNNGGAALDISKFSSPNVTIGVWYHVAFVRSGNNFMTFQDGIQCGAPTVNAYTMPDVAAVLLIGAYNHAVPTYYLNGWLDEFRVSKGVARWTGSFTPPTGAYASDSNTVLLLHMDGADGSTQFPDAVT